MLRSLATFRIPIPIAAVLAIVPVLVTSRVSAGADRPRQPEMRMASVDTASVERTEEPPNVLLILTDDQGCGDAGFMGNPELSTPNLDRLAAESTVLPRFYVSPVCAPTRASLLTGRYHQRTGVRGVIEGREFMVEAETTVAELLSEAGYRTGLIGKWHLGENYPRVPRAQGFDEFVGFLQGSSPYFDVTLTRNGRPYPTEGYLTDVFTDEAIGFLKEHRDRPFFLFLSYNAPHTPLEVPGRYIDPYEHLPERTRRIYAMMAALDENLGRLLGRLEELGLNEETLVLFTSDNGPLYGETPRFNCRLRGHKYQVYEGGIRVPLLARWPDRIPAGRRVSEHTMHIDLLPTLLDYAGVAVPDRLEVDGRSLRPLLSGHLPASPTGSETGPSRLGDRTLFMNYPGEGRLHEIMVGEEEAAPYPGGAAIEERFKMIDGDQLYDLGTEPDESENVAEAHRPPLRRLNEKYLDFWEAVQRERDSYPATQVGHPEENPVRITAHVARLSGGAAFQYQTDPARHRGLGVHRDWISQWNTSGAEAVWRIEVQEAAEYDISVRIRCPDGIEGRAPAARIEAGGASAAATLSGCRSSGTSEWSVQPVGTLSLPRGRANVRATVDDLASETDLDLSHLVIERLDTGRTRARPF